MLLRYVFSFATIMLGNAVTAETYDMSISGRAIGTLRYEVSGGVATMRSVMDNSPMGVFDGTVQATSDGVTYQSVSRSSRKARDIGVRFADGRAVETVVTPISERTDLSDVAVVPAGVIDPVAAMGRFVGAAGCPAAFRFYDGRRAMLLQPVAQTMADGVLVCDMNYAVTDGPGHLSPLYIKSISVSLIYDVSGAQSLREMTFGAAGFNLTLVRR